VASLLFSLRAKLVTFAIQLCMGGKVKSAINFKLGIASTCVAFAVVSGGCAMFEPKAERYVPPPMGSTWVSERRDTGSYGSGTVRVSGKRGEQTWQGQRVIAFESTDLTTLALQDGSWVGQTRGGNPVFTWDPPISYQWPLEVGKSWQRNFRVTIHASKQTVQVNDTQTVEAYEDVTVPAGTFKAFKLRTIGPNNDDVTWFSPELGIFVKQSLKRTAKSPLGLGTREIELISQAIRP
jgi:hypothetical protein